MEVIKVLDKKKVPEAIRYLSTLPSVTLDYETSCLDPKQIGAKVLSLSVGNKKKAYAFPVSHRLCPYLGQEMKILQPVFNLLQDKPVDGHNLKFEMRWSRLLGFEIKPNHDTMLCDHLLDENNKHGLDDITQRLFPDLAGYEEELYKHMTEKNNFESTPLEILLQYNGMDVITTDLVKTEQEKMLKKQPKLAKIFQTYQMYSLPAVMDMEDRGFTVDTKELERLTDAYNKIILQCEDKVRKYKPLAAYFKANPKFNFNSYPQLKDLMYNVLKLPVLKRTKVNYMTGSGGGPSLDFDTLELLQKNGKHLEVVEPLMTRSKAATQIKSFLKVFAAKIPLAADGKLRTNFNMHTVETLRLSSSGPNLQNIPTSEKLAEYNLEPIKSIFVSSFKNGKLIQADYSQIELRVCAMYTGDEPFTKAFKDGRDMHGELAAKVWGENYSKEQRTKAKRTNFSAIFDIQPESLSAEHKIPLPEAEELIKGFHKLHPEIFNWFDKIWDFAKIDGYIENAFGLRRRIANDLEVATKEYEIEAVKRQVWNFPIQSVVPMFMLPASRILMDLMKKKKLKSYIFGNVHDSIYVDSPSEEVGTVCKMIDDVFVRQISKMYKSFIGDIPLKIDIKVGDNLHNMEDFQE